ncbi:hypothetical protein HDU97_007476 [Phlyctochytrium planicorne]|nr:hypothetical protein HDU97_007476 [Phlyctochytrium planicorne]
MSDGTSGMGWVRSRPVLRSWSAGSDVANRNEYGNRAEGRAKRPSETSESAADDAKSISTDVSLESMPVSEESAMRSIEFTASKMLRECAEMLKELRGKATEVFETGTRQLIEKQTQINARFSEDSQKIGNMALELLLSCQKVQ